MHSPSSERHPARVRRRQPIGAALLILTMFGCRSEPEHRELTLDDLPTLSLQEELRIGSVDDPDFGFSRVGALDVDREGFVYVFEAQDMQIRVYDARGNLVRRIGRRGQGPGEFESDTKLGLIGDSLWVYDRQPRRLTLFSRDGALLSTATVHPVMVPVHSGFVRISPWAMRPDGLLVSDADAVFYSRPDDPPTGVQPTDRVPVPRVAFDLSGVVRDTIGWDERPNPRLVPPPNSGSNFVPPVQVGSQRYRVPEAPTALPSWLALHDGRIVVEQAIPSSSDAVVTVTRLDLNGDTVYTRPLRYQARQYTSAILDSLAERSARNPGAGIFMAGQGPPAPHASADPATVRALRAAMDFPAFEPGFGSPWLANDESVWLRRSGEGDEVRWVLLDTEGLPRGELQLGRSVRPLWSEGETAWVLEPDEFDVPWLVRYRIRAENRR